MSNSIPPFDFIGKFDDGAFDMNKIFQLNFSYNFDLLKSLLEGLLKAQKDNQNEINTLRKENESKGEKINKMEKQMIDLNILIQNSVGDKAAAEKLLEAKKELEILQEKEKEEAEKKKKEEEEKHLKEEQEKKNKKATAPAAQKQQQQPAQDANYVPIRKTIVGKKFVNDGIKLEVQLGNDELINKIIRKCNSLEGCINELAFHALEVPELKKNVESNTEKVLLHEKQISNIEPSLDELKKMTDAHDAKIKDMDIKMQDFNIIDMLKMNAAGGEGGDNSIALGLISNLEKKIMTKLKFVDERITKIDEDLFKMQKEVQNIKNTHESNKRAMEVQRTQGDNNEKKIGEINQRLDQFLADINSTLENNRNSIGEQVDQKLGELKSDYDQKLSGLMESTANNQKDKDQENKPNIDPQIEEKVKELNRKISEIERTIKAIPHHLNIDQLKNDISALKSGMVNKASSEEVKEARDKGEDLQKQLNYLKDLFEEYTGNQQDHEDLQTFKRKVESLTNKVHELEVNQTELILKGNQGGGNKGPALDFSKILDIKTFEEFKSQIIKEFNSVNDNFIHLRRLTDENTETLKTKTSFKDLKSLEDDLLAKLEDLRLACMRKFADRVDTTKNIKYLDTQIKHVIQVYIKKMDKGDNWLIAKKPINANLCASCESYLGDLKDNNNYVPWNKYPMRDPNDKLYRMGNGFSKMLQMIQVDENEKKNQGYQPFQTYGEFPGTLQGVGQGASGSKNDRDNSAPKTMKNTQMKGLPKIKTNQGKRTQGGEGTEQGMSINDSDEEDQNQPKITKIYRMNKE